MLINGRNDCPHSRSYRFQILKDVFGAELDKDRKARKWVFDSDKLAKLGRIYELQIDIQVIEGTTAEQVTLVTHPAGTEGKPEPSYMQNIQGSTQQLIENSRVYGLFSASSYPYSLSGFPRKCQEASHPSLGEKPV